MTQNISNTTKFISCLPFIGAAISSYNIATLFPQRNNKIDKLIDGIEKVQSSLTGLQILCGDQKAATKTLQEQKEKIKAETILHEKGRVYASCGVISCAVSVIVLTVIKVVFGTITTPGFLILIALSSINGMFFGKTYMSASENISLSNRVIKKLDDLINVPNQKSA